MAIVRFETLEEQLGFVDEATRSGVRVKIRGGLEVEVPDGYERGKTSEQLTAEAEVVEPETEPESEPEQAEKPAESARRGEWATYAQSRGMDPEGLTKAELIELFREE